MSTHIERARLLINQSRYEFAIKELQKALAADPDDPIAHALMAICLAEQKKFDQAYGEARQAAALAPDLAYAQYVLAYVRYQEDLLAEAERAINNAIQLDPWDADHFALLAQIKYQQSKWQDALKAAESGLEIEAEHLTCANLRAMALNRLGREDEAGRALEDALAQDPENALTHANQGWTALQRGEAQKALEHFRESLRLDPTNEWARSGMVEALKARYFVYRLMLKYHFFMSRLSGRSQWFVLIGLYFVAKIIPFLFIPYLIFVFLSWTSAPLSNLMLRLNRYGRLLLTKEEIMASNLVGGLLLTGAASVIIAALTWRPPAIIAAVGCIMITIPVAGSFSIEKPKPRKAMFIYTGVMGLLLVAGFLLALIGSDLYLALIPFFVLGFMVFSLIANGINMRS
ncbi:MAG TPA: tetratricopeptide repeat protein [Blastocatellia bacterium]|nr:tetratricopeptide repeat protein [Blastocatellia bacterium]